ncbi:hypothetical protein GW915_04995 [bacterium]|nr:hypothetical protein [bacterium]
MTSSKGNASKPEYLIIVPLRLNSTRIKQKVLSEINKESLAQRVLKKALEVQKRNPNVMVVAAIDSLKTKAHLKTVFGDSLQIVLTSQLLRTGSDRVFATFKTLVRQKIVSEKKVKAIVNLQGDMPFFDPQVLKRLMEQFKSVKPNHPLMWTLVQEWPHEFNPKHLSHVKAILAKDKRALYFSRYPIPCTKKFNMGTLLFHVGVYAYTPRALRDFCTAQSPVMEMSESLEQLRALYIGIPFFAEKVRPRPGFNFRGIDTASDLKWAKEFAKKGH